MNKKYLIIYHNEDNDGLFSMAIIYNYLHCELKVPKEEIVLFGTEYEKLKTVDLDEMISSFDKIIMTDVSFNDFSSIKKIYKEKKNSFCWIDHHAPIIKESIREGCGDICGIRDTHHSALLNAYKYFYDPFNEKYNNKELSVELFRILSAMDSFTYEQENYTLDYVRNVNTGIVNTYNLDPEKIISFVYDLLYTYNDADIKPTISKLEKYGEIFNKVEQDNYDKLVHDYGQEFTINDGTGRKTIALFIQGPTSSLIFRSIKNEYTNSVVFKHLKHGDWGISLYNTDIKYDSEFHCGEYLKKNYGGGGHAGAAGCKVTEEQFIEILKNRTI